MPSPDKTPRAIDDSPTATTVSRQLRIVFNAVKSHFREVERTAGIGGAQLWALSVIAGTPGIGVTELARALDIHQSTASNLVRTLATRGLLESRREGADRRTAGLYVLDAGIQLLHRAPAPFAGVLPQALAELSPVTLKQLEHDLNLLIALLDKDETSAQVPLAHL